MLKVLQINTLFFFIIGMLSCTAPSFYEKAYNFNKEISTGDFAAAEQLIIDNEEKLADSKIRFLFFVNGGIVEHLKGDFVKSNAYFEKADLFVEDGKKKLLEETSALLINPKLSTYRGEDHEILLINYYKALNYYMLGNINDALVEVKRLNLRLQALSEKYKDDNKFKEDAFMHVLMGMIYEANNNYNDAFIAYRNGYEIYESYYLTEFNLGAPEQLKKDLVRTAALSAMREEQLSYEEKFGFKYQKDNSDASLILLWHNGMGPVKEEWGINFAIIYTGGGWVAFVNEKYGLSFPFYIGDADLYGLTWIKVVFPRYVKRDMMFTSATAKSNLGNYPLELAEDINAISFKVLEERMLAEFSKSLLRVALKQVAAYKIGDANDSKALGAALSVLASASESADTRNWQTIPHSVYYTRVALNQGKQTVKVTMHGEQVSSEEHEIEVEVVKGQTKIFPFYSLGAYEPKTLNRAK